MTPSNPVYPTETGSRVDANGNSSWVMYGMTVQQYIAIEMAKALIGRKDSMIFSKDDIAREALEMADALIKVVP